MGLADLGTPAAFREHINWDHDELNDRTHEGVQMELKAGPKENHPEKLVHTIAAFANTLGGTIIVGVGEGGKKTGLTYADGLVPVKNGDKLRRDVTHLLGPRLNPSPPVRIHVLDIDEDGKTKQVVVLQVQPSVRIIGCRGEKTGEGLRYLYRTEHGNQDMTPMEVEAHILNAGRARRLQLEQAFEEFDTMRVVERHPDLRGENGAALLREWHTGTVVHGFSEFGVIVRPRLCSNWGKEGVTGQVPEDWELVCIPYECVKLVVPGATPDSTVDVHVAGYVDRGLLPSYEQDADQVHYYEFVPDID